MKGVLLSCLLLIGISGIAQPIISSFSPLAGSAGMSITIAGTGFNSVKENNIVYFGAVKAVVTAASNSQLVVTVPNGATYAPLTVLNSASLLSTSSVTSFIPVSAGTDAGTTSVLFASGVNFTAGSSLSSICINDMDGDGRPDVAALNDIDATISIFRNTSTAGAVTFAARSDLGTGGNVPYQMAMGDFDGDGKIDIVTANFNSNTISIKRNTSIVNTISFGSNILYGTGSAPYSVVISDVNLDGKPDIITANAFASSVSIFINSSTGSNISFIAQADLQIGDNAGTYGLTVCDLDGDKKPDIALTDNTNGKLVIYRNLSPGGSTVIFGSKQLITLADVPQRIDAVDVDQDGKPDLCIAYRYSTKFSVLRNLSAVGSISFASATDYPTVLKAAASGSCFFAFADVDGDGKPDLCTSNGNVLKNNSTPGTLAFAAKTNVGFDASCIAAGDLDADGRPDLITGYLSLNVLRNTAKPKLTSVTISSGNALSQVAKPGDIVTVSIGSVNPVTPVITVAGNATSVSHTGNNWTGKYTMQVSDAGGIIPFNISFTDGDGIAGSNVTTTTNSSTVTFDKTPPTVTSVSRMLPLTAVTKATAVVFRVVFSEPIQTAISSSFQATTTGTLIGSVGSVTQISSTACDVKVNISTNDGTVRLDVNSVGSDIYDLAGNQLIGGFSTGEIFTIDQTAKPTLNSFSISSNNPINAAKAKVGDIIAATFSTSEPIQTPVVTIAGHMAQVTNTSGNNWQAAYAMSSSDNEGNVAVAVAFTDVTASHIAGTTVNNTLDASTVTFDKTTPVVTSISRLTPASATIINNISITYRVNFSELVTGITTSSFQVTSTENMTATIAGVSAYSGVSVDVTINVTNSSGTLRLDLKNTSSGVTDYAGNDVPGFISGQIYTFDQLTQSPVLTLPAQNSVSFTNFLVKGSIPEPYLPGSVKLNFDNGNTVTTITLANSIVSQFSFSINMLDPVATPEVASGAALGGGTYTVTLAYQDVLGNAAAYAVSKFVTIKIPAAPVVTSYSATNISRFTASLIGNINGNGVETTTIFEYGTDPALLDSTTITKIAPGLNKTTAGYVINIKDLAAGTTYYYRIKVSNNLGASASTISSFITKQPIPVISSFSPQSGGVGREVVISGSFFNPDPAGNIVYFGGVKGSVTSAAANQLKVTVPSGAGSEPISVLNVTSKLTAYSANAFKTTYSVAQPASWSAGKVFTNVDGGAKSFALADLNGDGKNDVAISTREDFAISDPPVTVPTGLPKVIVSGNFTFSNSLETGLAMPSKSPQQIDAESDIGEVNIRDMNGDGKPDIITANRSGNSISLLRNISTGGALDATSFATRFNISAGSNVTGITTADLDLDGRPDIIAVCGNKVSIFKNQFTGAAFDASSFATAVNFTGISAGGKVVAADIDGDGKPDIVVTSGTNVSIFRNVSDTGIISTGSFATPVDFPIGYVTSDLAIGDIDIDGKPDIAVTTANASTALCILRNNAFAGSITASSMAAKTDIPSGASSSLTSIAIGDLDGDGKPELVVGNYSDYSVRVFPNKTQAGTINSSSFDSYTSLPFASTVKVAIQDIDNDGRPDIVVANDFGFALYYVQHYTWFIIYKNNLQYAQPIINSFSPTSAATGETVTITGKNLTGAKSVSFGGKQARSFREISDTVIEAVVDEGNSGAVSIETQGGNTSLAGFTWLSPFTEVKSFSPVSAHTGDTVAIKGRNFTSALVVSFGSVNAISFTVASDTLIRAIVGTGASGLISVVTPKGTGTAQGFSYLGPAVLPIPVITSFSPLSAASGATVTIKGTNLSAVSVVLFGGLNARSFIIDSATQIRAVVDTGFSGSISVINTAGTGTIAGFSFIASGPDVIPAPVITSFSPASAASGTTVVIRGSNLTGATSVRFGDVNARSFTIDSAGQIKAIVDTGASGSVHITTLGGATALSGFTYIKQVVLAAPVIISFNPLTAVSGSTITIKGSGFTNVNAVRFGDSTAVSVTIENDSLMSAVVGKGASGSVYATSTAGTGSLKGFNFIPATPVITYNSPISFCDGLSVILVSSITGYDNQWFRSGVPIANNKGNTLKVTLPGIYTVIAGNNGFVSDFSAGVKVSVITAPVIAKPTINGYSKDTLVCFTDGLTLSVSGSYDKYLWSTGETTPAISVTKPGLISVKVGSNSQTCYSVDSSIIIDARKNITPVPVLTRTDNSLVSTVSDNYRWTLNNILLPNVNNNILQLGSKGAYAVSTSKDNTCWSTSIDYFVLLDPVTIKKAFDLTMYPNPSSGVFSIQIKFDKNISAVVSITISDQAGLVKYTAKKLLFSDKTIRIPISAGLGKGTYAVKVDVNGEVNTQQMIVL